MLMMYSPYCRAQEHTHEEDTPEVTTEETPACETEWCDARWPPDEGSDRTVGKDNCGNVCIKIEKKVEIIAEIEKKNNPGVTVTISTDENGKPIFNASCPTSGKLNEWEFKALEAGYKAKLKSKNGGVYTIYEK